jgi:hypothetical protein
MPVKRRTPKSRINLSPEAYAAFEAGDKSALRAAIGQKAWEMSPLAAGPTPPSWYRDEYWIAIWRKARDIRLELMRGLRRNPANSVKRGVGG